ncbi:MAG TPA: PHP domain-containing protein [Candidatus Limnocylindrales bacterium]|nr:PHP domain-containing protein [Candidatus Limnocylindrales bacterium]
MSEQNVEGRQRGRADLHIHSLASDGIDGVERILARAEELELDVIAITDHERIDAALAAQAMARARGMRVHVIVGEEISTRGGHVVALFLEQRIRPWQSLRSSIAQVHEQGGLAIVAHPLVPYPLCASGRSIRRLLADADQAVHPDAIEAFNPTTAASRWGRRVPDFARQLGLPEVASSDAHRAVDIGTAVTTFGGSTPNDLRQAIIEGTTEWQGSPYALGHQLKTFRGQLSKYAHAVRDEVQGKLLRDGTGRDLGYPGGRRRPPRFDEGQP